MKALSILVGLSLVGALIVVTQRPSAPSTSFPAENWETIDPADAGFDPDVLKEFIGHVAGNGVLTRNGKLVASWGEPNVLRDVASA